MRSGTAVPKAEELCRQAGIMLVVTLGFVAAIQLILFAFHIV
jgi:hypothetical protein